MIKLNLNFNDAYTDGDTMYFSSRDFNGLFRMKKGEVYAEWIGQFPGETAWHKNLHLKIVEHNRKLFFLPFSGHGIHRYDLEKKDFKFYPLHSEKTFAFSNAITVNGKIYLIPLNIHTPFMIYDIENESIDIDGNFWKRIGKGFDLTERHYIGGFGAALADWRIYIAIAGLNAVICYDIHSHAVALKKLNFLPRGIQYLDGFFYFTVNDSYKIVICDTSGGIAGEILARPGKAPECPYSSVIRSQDKLFLMPGGYGIDVTEITFIGEEQEVRYYPLTGAEAQIRFMGLYKNYLRKGDHILFLPKSGNGILIFDLSRKTMELHRVECRPSDAEQCYALCRCGSMEGKNSLEMYMELLKNDAGKPEKNIGNKKIGKRILEMCKGENECMIYR